MTLKELIKIEEDDTASRMAIIIDQVEDKGEPEDASVRRGRLN